MLPISDNIDNTNIQSAVPMQSTSVRLKKRWHSDQLCSESESDSDAVEVLPAPKKLKQVEQLLVLPSVITISEGTQTFPIKEDSADYLTVHKALVSQLQVEELKNKKLTQQLELGRFETVKLLSQVEHFQIQFAKDKSQSITLRGSPSLLHRAAPSTLRPGEIIMIYSHFLINK